MMLEEALFYLKECVKEEIKSRGKPDGEFEEQFYRGQRWGAFNMLARIGFENAALEAVREVEEG